MAGNFGFELVVEFTKVFLPPELAHFLFAAQAEVRPLTVTGQPRVASSTAASRHQSPAGLADIHTGAPQR